MSPSGCMNGCNRLLLNRGQWSVISCWDWKPSCNLNDWHRRKQGHGRGGDTEQQHCRGGGRASGWRMCADDATAGSLTTKPRLNARVDMNEWTSVRTYRGYLKCCCSEWAVCANITFLDWRFFPLQSLQRVRNSYTHGWESIKNRRFMLILGRRWRCVIFNMFAVRSHHS